MTAVIQAVTAVTADTAHPALDYYNLILSLSQNISRLPRTGVKKEKNSVEFPMILCVLQ